MTIFGFFKVRFLGFYKAERKSEDIFVLRRVRAFHRYHIELSYDALSPLPIVLSKHFNHPHPYIEIATAISDRLSYSNIIYRYVTSFVSNALTFMFDTEPLSASCNHM